MKVAELESRLNRQEAELAAIKALIENLVQAKLNDVVEVKSTNVLELDEEPEWEPAEMNDNNRTTFSGIISKAGPDLEFPENLYISWHNLLEGDDIRDGSAWKHATNTSFMLDKERLEFSIEMDMTAEEFAANITSHNDTIFYWSSDLDESGIETLLNSRLAIGFVEGDFAGGEATGPNVERATADMFAVFFRSGEHKVSSLPKVEDCNWFDKLPQGFSCGRGAPADPNCGKSFFDIFVPVSCDELVLKIASKRCEKHVTVCDDEGKFCKKTSRKLADLGNRPDCLSYVNYT